MAMLDFQCGKCHRRFGVARDLPGDGSPVRCPYCGGAIDPKTIEAIAGLVALISKSTAAMSAAEIRQAREKSGLRSIEQAAKIAGISLPLLRAIESGETKAAPDVCAKLDEAYGVGLVNKRKGGDHAG
jgi:DNA-directed RNA polymerase subunit RPC12/RpoP/DNA-binding transcriptional regulator YiaG